MRVLDAPPLNLSGQQKADALIEEARQRQRRRRRWVGSLVLIVLVASGIWAAINGGSRVRPPPSTRTPEVKHPTSPSGSSRKGAKFIPIDFHGKYGVSAPAFPTADEGFVIIGGFPGGNGPQTSWLERTTDGGRTWTTQPDFGQNNVAFNTPADGWLYGPSLYKTVDTGRTWQQVHIEGLPGSVVTDSRYTWVDGQPKPTASSNPECEPTLMLRSTALGLNPTPIHVQPSLSGYCNAAFVAPTGSKAYVLFVNRAGASLLDATDNGGESWATRAAPCNGNLLAENASVLALTCPYGQQISPGVSRVHMFQSTDGGKTWSRTRPVNEYGPIGRSLVRSSPLVSWSWTEYNGTGAGNVERTSDGGLYWRVIFPNGAIHVVPPLRPTPYILPVAFVPRSSSSALLLIEAYSSPVHFLLGATTNGGSTWKWSYLVNERPATATSRSR